MPFPRQSRNAATLGSALVICCTLVAHFEGLRTSAYRDINGLPTICYGETHGVVMGQTDTPAECTADLQARLAQMAGYIQPCIKVAVPPPTMAAFVSFAYNAGSGNFCKSNIARDLNAGHLSEACSDFSDWVYSGGKRVQGLVNRRAVERAYCEEGLTWKPPPISSTPKSSLPATPSPTS